jgi:DNA polymerase-3 subunit delta'
VKGFESISGQDKAVNILRSFIQKGKIPHALLFTGIEGIGKKMSAVAFAMACNCERISLDLAIINEKISAAGALHEVGKGKPIAPCGACRPCKKILSGSHPDILIIEPAGPVIKIAQIRDILRILNLKPYEAKVRVVIVLKSNTMNASASNALLKVLEEPPDRSILILIAQNSSDLLPTIVSRCRHIRFNPLLKKDIAALLKLNCGIDNEKAEIISNMANGSYARALEMSKSNWIAHRKWLIRASGLDKPEMLAKMPKNLLLAFSEKLAKNKETVLNSLDIIKMWTRDLLVWKYSPEKIINKDLAENIKQASQNIHTEFLLKKVEAIEQAQRDIKENMNLRLCLDILAMNLGKA